MNHDPYLKLRGRGKITARFMQTSGHWTQRHETIKALGEYMPPPKECQWIEGEPTCDDSCKCLRPTKPDKPYCEEHCKRAYTTSPAKAVSADTILDDLELRYQQGKHGPNLKWDAPSSVRYGKGSRPPQKVTNFKTPR